MMPIIQFVMPSRNKQLKKLLHFYWEVCPKYDENGKLKQEMILVVYVFFEILRRCSDRICILVMRFEMTWFVHSMTYFCFNVTLSPATSQRIYPRCKFAFLAKDCERCRTFGTLDTYLSFMPRASAFLRSQKCCLRPILHLS